MLVCIRFDVGIAHLRRQVILGAGLADEALIGLFGTLVPFHLTLNLRTHRIQWLNTALCLFIEDMPSVLGANRRTDLAGLHAERCIFEGFHHHAFSEPTQVAATTAAAAILRLHLRYFGEVLRRYDLGNAVDEGFLDLAEAVCRHHFHDMCCFYLYVVPLFLYQHDMIAVLGAEDLTDLSDRRVIRGLFQRIDIAERRDPT